MNFTFTLFQPDNSEKVHFQPYSGLSYYRNLQRYKTLSHMRLEQVNTPNF